VRSKRSFAGELVTIPVTIRFSRPLRKVLVAACGGEGSVAPLKGVPRHKAKPSGPEGDGGMPKRRKRKCSEPRCCWHQGSKGRTSEGCGGGREARPTEQTLS
jgi:hypothetical protein